MEVEASHLKTMGLNPAMANLELISNKSPAYLKNLLADIKKDLIDLEYIKNYNQEFLIDLAYAKTKK